MNKMPTLSNLILLFYLQVAITAIVGQKCKGGDTQSWSYEGKLNGPEKWKNTYPLCGGRSQSPIDIDTYSTKSSTTLKPLMLIGYNRTLKTAVIENNGYTVEVTPTDRIWRYIEVDNKKYHLSQFHFHWSEDEGKGSEHALDGTRFNMEAHFVHTSADDKIAVVGVIYEVTSDQNEALQQIINILPKIRYQDRRTYFKGNINLENFFPGNPAAFYRYLGSLTTPPCTEGVTWSVVQMVMPIGEDQLAELLNLYAVPKKEAGRECRITTNVRPLQPINYRIISESA